MSTNCTKSTSETANINIANSDMLVALMCEDRFHLTPAYLGEIYNTDTRPPNA
jgi:hypothetical protein